MSSSAATAQRLVKRAKRSRIRQRFKDGMTDIEFQKRADIGWREFFLARGINPDAMRINANFEGRFGRKAS